MQTIKEAIGNYTVPELDICEYRSSYSPYINNRPRQLFQAVRQWGTFEEEMAAFNFELDKPFDGSLRREYPVNTVNCEMRLIWEFCNHIRAPFLSILKSMGYDYTLRESGGLKSIKFDPKYVLLSNTDYQSPICLFEFKEPWLLPIHSELDVADCIAKEENMNRRNRKLSIAVAQLHGYMIYNEMKYGVLTNYEFSIFFCRSSVEESTLLYSKPVGKREILQVLVQFFFMIKGDAIYKPPKPRSVEDLKPFISQGTNKVSRIEPENYMFSERIADIKQGGVVFGYLGGATGKVVFKVKNLARESGVGALIQREADHYEAMRELQGIAIPVFHGLVDFNGVFYGAITEYCGAQLPKTKDQVEKLLNYDGKVVKKNAISALGMIHAKGHLHGSIYHRNICVDEFNNVKFIDLERSVLIDIQGEFDGEMKKLCDLFSD